MTVHDLVNAVTSGKIDSQLSAVHRCDDMQLLQYRAAAICAAENFSRMFPLRTDVRLFFAPSGPDISLKFGDFRVSAAASREVAVILSVHDEAESTVIFGDRSTADPELAAVVDGVTAEFGDIPCFDAVFQSPLPHPDPEELRIPLRSVLRRIFEEKPRSDVDLLLAGYSLCMTENCPVSEPAEVPELHELDSLEELIRELPALRGTLPESEIDDICRYFAEKDRCAKIADAAGQYDTGAFFRLLDRSWTADPGVSTALTVSRDFLGGDGAAFPENGCVMAFVPTYAAERYAENMDRCMGRKCTRIMTPGSDGAYEIKI